MIKPILLSLVTLSAPAFAGAANATLKCQSQDGLKIEGSVPGDFDEFNLTLSKGAAKAEFFSILGALESEVTANARISIVQSLQEGVWTLRSNKLDANSFDFVEAYAVPKTLKYKATPEGYRASFTAKAYMFLSSINEDE